jgi:predicted MFS family arabinose efflux permease
MAKRSLQQHVEAGQGSASGRRMLVPAGLATIGVTYGLARYGYGLYLPEFRADFGLSARAAGSIASGSFLAYCLAAALAARLVAVARPRLALWLAGGSAALGSALVAVAWSGEALAVGALVAGSGAGLATPALVEAVASTVPAAAEPRAQGVVNSGTGVGVVLGGLVVLVAPTAWREAWVGFALVALCVTWWVDRCATWPRPPAGPAPTRSAGELRRLRLPVAAAVLAGSGCANVWTFGRDLMTDAGVPAGTTGLLWCLLGAAGLLGGLSGVLVQRAGLPAAWLVSVGLAGAATALLGWRPGVVPAAALSLTCFGAAFVALSGVLIAWGACVAPEAAGRAAAVVFIALTAGQALGAVVLGAVADATGSRVTFLVAAGLLVLAGAGPCAVLLGRPGGRGA